MVFLAPYVFRFKLVLVSADGKSKITVGQVLFEVQNTKVCCVCNVVIWQKEDLQSLYYWATGGLKHMDMEPFKVSHKESLKWILGHYRTTLQMHWDDKASGIKLLSWKFMKGKVEWGNLHIQVEYPLLSKPVTPDLSLDPFDKRKALQFLIDNPKMNLRYKQVVPQK